MHFKRKSSHDAFVLIHASLKRRDAAIKAGTTPAEAASAAASEAAEANTATAGNAARDAAIKAGKTPTEAASAAATCIIRLSLTVLGAIVNHICQVV